MLLPRAPGFSNVMQNSFYQYPRVADDDSWHHSMRAIETAHYLRQIIISKRRRVFQVENTEWHARRVAQTLNSWKP